MKTTKNCGLVQPEQDDFYDVDNFSDNMEVLDEHLGNLETPVYEEATKIAEPESGENYKTLFGKVKKAVAALIAHLADKDNPHGVTLAQIGAAAADSLSAHVQNKSNPHSVTKAQVGLGNCDNTADSAKSVKYATSAGSATNAESLGDVLAKYYLQNPYADSTDIKQGIRFDKNSGGNYFAIRPSLANKLLYLMLNDSKNLINVDESGNVTLAGDLFTAGLSIGLNGLISNYLRTFSSGGIAYIGQPMSGGTSVTQVAAVDSIGTKNYVPMYAHQFINSAGDTLTSDSGSMVMRARDGAQLRIGATQVIVTNNSYSAYTQVVASGFSNQSSKLVKENIRNMTQEEADKILSVRVVDFDYKENFGSKNQHGVIAEEVETILPCAVATPDGYDEAEFDETKGIDQKIKTVDYSKFVPYLIAEVQLQEERISELLKRVETLEKGA